MIAKAFWGMALVVTLTVPALLSAGCIPSEPQPPAPPDNGGEESGVEMPDPQHQGTQSEEAAQAPEAPAGEVAAEAPAGEEAPGEGEGKTTTIHAQNANEGDEGEGSTSSLAFDLDEGPSAGATPPEQGTVAQVAVQRAPDELAYIIRGSLGLEGRISKANPEDEMWNLNATFTFPTGGFDVGAPMVIPITDVSATGEGIQMQRSATNFLILLPVRVPTPDAVVTQAEEVRKVHSAIRAPNDAVFNLQLTSMP